MKSFTKDLLRFSTAGSVDDGKSTLIGRLLYDSKQVYEDQLEAIQDDQSEGDLAFNLANLTDGLRAEREQGITIDVAYRYFATPKRKFIVADTPGHIQYTRNMVTGASTSQLAIVLIDAREGAIEQTRRHVKIASLLGIEHIVLCVNKMDLVDYSEKIFKSIVDNFIPWIQKLDVKHPRFIPISALKGDNCVEKSASMQWYDGPSLLEYLEAVEVDDSSSKKPARFPIQYVIRPNTDAFHDFRGLAGRVAGGSFKVGDTVQVLPSGNEAKITGIHTYDGKIEVAQHSMSVAITLDKDLDISRGDVLVASEKKPNLSSEIKAQICWMHEKPMHAQTKWIMRHNTKTTRAMLKEVHCIFNINTFEKDGPRPLQLNDIGEISLRTMTPLVTDSYKENKTTGSFILIDEATNATLAAGMIV